MIGKNPLFVSRQHGHSVTTMWRTYAAWMERALESDIALIQAAMNRDGPSIERASNTRTELTLKAPAVAGLGTRLATRHEASEAQLPDKKGQKKWRRGWDYSLRASPLRGRPSGRYPRFVAATADPGPREFMSRVAERVGLSAAAPRILRFAPDRRVRVVQNRCAILSNPGRCVHTSCTAK
jgi:hypothetical protein